MPFLMVNVHSDVNILSSQSEKSKKRAKKIDRNDVLVPVRFVLSEANRSKKKKACSIFRLA
jgi:hypothetical protein